MRLSFRDRYRLLFRAVKIAVNPKSTNLTFMWRNGEGETLTHAFWSDDPNNPKDVVFELFARVAGRHDTLKEVNNTLANLALESAKQYAAHNNLNPTDFVATTKVLMHIDDLKVVNEECSFTGKRLNPE